MRSLEIPVFHSKCCILKSFVGLMYYWKILKRANNCMMNNSIEKFHCGK